TKKGPPKKWSLTDKSSRRVYIIKFRSGKSQLEIGESPHGGRYFTARSQAAKTEKATKQLALEPRIPTRIRGSVTLRGIEKPQITDLIEKQREMGKTRKGNKLPLDASYTHVDYEVVDESKPTSSQKQPATRGKRLAKSRSEAGKKSSKKKTFTTKFTISGN
ncbi:MAG: hypothetical protein MI919_12320, partial [Holophagales bacterium]|nr:hypothetical protein [Holophagales bacterium]